MKYFHLLMISVLAITFFSCQTSKEEFATESVADYYPTQIGKSITYRVDSLVFAKSGTIIETHKYRVKHTIQSELTDAANRKSYLVNRLINNENGTGPWLENGNYTVTPLTNSVEVMENNLRVIKLRQPFSKGFNWKGNAYLPVSPYRPVYDMDAGSDMNNWNFVYSNFGDTTVNGQQYKNVWTVLQNNFVLNIPPSPGSLGLKEVGLEQYAKGIGLVYRNYELYEYQPGHADNAYQPTYTGFGVTMWMIDHN